MAEKRPQLHLEQNAEIELSDDDDENMDEKEKENKNTEHLKASPPRQQQPNQMDEWFRKRTPKTPVENKQKSKKFKGRLYQLGRK